MAAHKGLGVLEKAVGADKFITHQAGGASGQLAAIESRANQVKQQQAIAAGLGAVQPKKVVVVPNQAGDLAAIEASITPSLNPAKVAAARAQAEIDKKLFLAKKARLANKK